ncbi:MAG TPA: hypothetical protein VHS56_00485 [Candidatus Cybelea sp.]|nr:hypothetical protein [Candidatus Cybelea sp.]
MKSTSFLVVAGSALLALAGFAGAPRGLVAVAATPPPSPPPINGAVTPPPPPAADAPSNLPTPSAIFPVGGSAPSPHASGTPSPPPAISRRGLDGVWEVAIQHPNTTDYTHFYIKQQGDQLSGTYLDAKKKQYPLVGTIDGQNIRLIVTMPGGTTILAEAKLDGTTDMVGILSMAGGETAFTASYRPKEKWIENINASPGGMSQPGGYTPP